MEHLTVGQAAEALGLSVPTVKRYIYNGTLKAAKLPGGQHRIPRSEVERLLSIGEPESIPDDATDAERTRVLEKWVTELQLEVERLGASLEVLSAACVRGFDLHRTPTPDRPAGSHTVAVLGPGCKRCEALYEMTKRVLAEMDAPGVTVEHVTDLNRIVEYGPLLTPALVVDGAVLLSGKTPNDRKLRALLAEALSS